jgi:pyruvate-ferredoxin/flavodoxin oxidoreductase
MAMAYGNVYVAKIAFGAKDAQTVKAFLEAESYRGPSLIIAYSHCIAHGYDLAFGAEQQKLAVDSGYWPLYRFDPRRVAQGETPLQIDSAPPKSQLAQFVKNETRFRMVEQQDPSRFRELIASSQEFTARRLALYTELAKPTVKPGNGNGNGAKPEAKAEHETNRK